MADSRVSESDIELFDEYSGDDNSFYGFVIRGTNFSDHSDVNFRVGCREQASGEISDDDGEEEAQWTDRITDSSFLTLFNQQELTFTFQMTTVKADLWVI